MRALSILAALALLWTPVVAGADPPNYATAVTACGTPGNTPVAGNSYPITQDLTGRSCGSVTGTVTAVPTYYPNLGTNSSPITVGASASLIVAARASRAMLIIINETANSTRCSSVNTVTSGGGGATTGGFQITATIGASVTLLNYSGALYCAGATTVSATEVY